MPDDDSPSIRRETSAVRSSLAGRVSALVLMVLVAAGLSALVMLGQLRAFEASFDRLTGVYVVFNQRLAEAHVQAVRVHELIRSYQKQSELAPGRPEPPDQLFLSNFKLAVEERNIRIGEARQPIDEALANPTRFRGEVPLNDLREIQASLDELETLADLDESTDPFDVLTDVGTQNQISQLFKSLATQSKLAIAELDHEVRRAQVKTKRLMLALTLATTVLGVLAMLGVFVTLRPLRQLSARVRNLGRGEWGQRVRISGSNRGDEVSQLANEFNLMAAALEERERRLLRGERLAAAGQLAAQITHEIRNPLSSVALNVELLEDEITQPSSEVRNLLRQITKEVDRLTAITEDYLSFARRPAPERARVDVNAELRSLLEFMVPEFDARGVALEVDVPRENAWVNGDSNQLRQAFLNLVRNAIEALSPEEGPTTGREPRIKVTAERKGDQVAVVVADNGPGIELPSEQLERVFEAFYTSKARGTGLGLSTVQQIVADHEGVVRVAQTSAHGTSFEVVLPACADDVAPVSSHPTNRSVETTS